MAAATDKVRATVQRLADERGESLAWLSAMLGRNAAYLQQFVGRGSPKVLPEEARLALAMHWRIDERRLGAREPWRP